MKSDDKKLILYSLIGTGALLLTRYILRKTRAYSFENKIVLVASGARGLGLSLTKKLLQRKAKVVICAKDEEELNIAKEELKEYDQNMIAMACDVRARDQVDHMINTIYDTIGYIDVLINNSDSIEAGPMEAMNYKDYDEAFATHFWGPLHTTLAVLPKMKERREGRIINISSLGGKVSIPHLLPYSASKFALTGFSEGLHSELKKNGIIVTTACPGLTRTGGYTQIKAKGNVLQEYDWFSSAESLPLLSSSADSVANEILNASATGDAEVIVSLPAKILNALNGLFPGTISDLFTLFNEYLPHYKHNGHKPEDAEEDASITGIQSKDDPNQSGGQ